MVHGACCVAVFAHHSPAEVAARDLLRSGVDPASVSLVGRGRRRDQAPTGFESPTDRSPCWGEAGSEALVFPGLGPVVLHGGLARTVLAVLDRACVPPGVTAVGAGLLDLGVPREPAGAYEDALRIGRCLALVLAGSEDAAAERRVLAGRGPDRIDVYRPPRGVIHYS